MAEGEFWKNIDVRKANFGWPSYSPDLNPADFFLWGFLKERVYLGPVQKKIEQLKNNIRREAKKLKIDMVKRLVGQYVKKADLGTRTTTISVGTRKYGKIRAPVPSADTGT